MVGYLYPDTASKASPNVIKTSQEKKVVIRPYDLSAAGIVWSVLHGKWRLPQPCLTNMGNAAPFRTEKELGNKKRVGNSSRQLHPSASYRHA
ncbi:hypothetical protein FJTKL_13660 [Diaporthe vaccinii]|uniref:Uncharacterized protein n=1 Tax=Diaporthe vaccinii TaxID=105482 RepID=A0ABR4E9M8_9PEZI